MSPRTEQELLDQTVELATRCRWAVHHDRPARRSGNRWATAIQGHAGFPDLVLARNGVVLFRELKGYDARGRLGKVTLEQRGWGEQLDRSVHLLAALVGGGTDLEFRRGLLFDVWTPDDWQPLIIPILTARIGAAVPANPNGAGETK